MEELRPEELEGLVQELEEEGSAQEALPKDVEEVLRVLQSSSNDLARRDAAEQLGKIDSGSTRVVRALRTAYESDSCHAVNREAAKSLRAPVHQAYLQRHPDLREEMERALRRAPGSRTAGEQYLRKKPAGNVRILLMVPVGIVCAGIGLATYAANPNWASLLFSVAGVAATGWALWSWLAPSSARNLFRRSMKETSGNITHLLRDEHKGEYGTTYTYYAVVRFMAVDSQGRFRDIGLTIQVSEERWSGMVPGTLTIRYAADDPTIALIEGE